MIGLALVLAFLQPSPSEPRPAEGWALELVAEAPRLRHPSAVTCSPDGRIFVGEDYIDMEGPIDRPVDRIVCIHPDGRITVFADRLGPVFGLLYMDGKLYVQHVPKFSVFSDAGDSACDRFDLLESTNPTPSAGNGLNDHIPANFHLGMDGFFYVAVGQKGMFGVVGRDGRPFEMREGGILRMRPDGTELEVFARGVRNILDIGLTSEDELFVYDNDDHTKTWKVKLLHMVDGGYYGFPWDIKPARPYTLGGVTEYPGGAPTGMLAYTEDALPPAFDDNLILCDWGRRTVFRVRLDRDGATYRVAGQEDLIPPGPNDFRPVGVAVSPDGRSFYITDWNFAGWKQKKDVGRLWKLTWKGPSRAQPKPSWFLPASHSVGEEETQEDLIEGLAHPAESVRLLAQRRLVAWGPRSGPALLGVLGDRQAPARARRHALWALDALGEFGPGREAIRAALEDPDLRAQAIRALGTRRRTDAAAPLAKFLDHSPAEIRFGSAAALGRIADPAGIERLERTLDDEDGWVRYAAWTALRRMGSAHPEVWPQIGQGLWSDRPAVREGTLWALREAYDPAVAAVLASYLGDRRVSAARRAAILPVVLELVLRPPPWDGRWWRNGPYAFAEDRADVGPRIDRTERWAGSSGLEAALRAAEEDPAPNLQAALAALRRSLATPPSVPPVAAPQARVPSPPASSPNSGSGRPRPKPEEYAAVARKAAGDPARGLTLFHDRARGGCSRCHRIAGQGGALGPDLAGIGSKYDREFLIESVLYPSRQIAEGFAQTMAKLRSGEVLTGLIQAETPDELLLVDAQGHPYRIAKREIEVRKVSETSLMPEKLQEAYSPEEFSDLIAFLASLQEAEGFVPLLGGKNLEGWVKDPENEGHWTQKEGEMLFYDGKGRDLWTQKSYGNFILQADWRFPPVEAGGKPFVEKEAPVILPDGSVSDRKEKVLDAGDSGIFLRGSQKSQVNIWCWPIGSGEIYGYRTDPNLSPEVRAAATPKVRADRPPGQWNHFEITLRGDRLTVVLNQKTVIDNARLPGIPARGPIGLQRPGNPLTRDMPLEFARLRIKELP